MIKVINSNKARTIREISLKKGKNEIEFKTNGDFNEWLIGATPFLICEAVTFDGDKFKNFIPEDEVDNTEIEEMQVRH